MQAGRRRRHPDLSQGTLQIESGIGRLLRRNRAVDGKEAPPEHMVPGAVDGFNADELPGFVTEGGECSRAAIAAHHHLVIARRQTRDLKLVRTLVAPEPW